MATILIVEDEILLADCYRRWLEADGHKIQHACDAQSAIDLIDQHGPQVIILDVLLAGANGIQVLHTLRSYTDLAHTPVIVCSNAVTLHAINFAPYGVRKVLDKSLLSRRSLAAAVAGVL